MVVIVVVAFDRSGCALYDMRVRKDVGIIV